MSGSRRNIRVAGDHPAGAGGAALTVGSRPHDREE